MEKFNAATIAHVTGYSVSTVTSWAAHNKKSVKDGLTVPEIMTFCRSQKQKRQQAKWTKKRPQD